MTCWLASDGIASAAPIPDHSAVPTAIEAVKKSGFA
jgi:hypothetical protein